MNTFLKKHLHNRDERDMGSVIDYLADCYLMDNPISSEQIKHIQEKMTPYFEGIPLDASDTLFQLVYGLCGAYEDAAFRAGLLIGTHLKSELDTPYEIE